MIQNSPKFFTWLSLTQIKLLAGKTWKINNIMIGALVYWFFLLIQLSVILIKSAGSFWWIFVLYSHCKNKETFYPSWKFRRPTILDFQILQDKETKLKEEYADEAKVIPKPDYW